MDEAPPVLLEVRQLAAGYDGRDVITSLDMSLHAGEFTVLLGHNGSGKSTLLKALAGVLPVHAERLAWEGTDIRSMPVRQRISLGIAYVPQGSCVFGGLTVMDNLELRGSHFYSRRELKRRIELVLEAFPGLANRNRQPAGLLSGGEKQMLAIAGALVANPRLLLLDEPSLGLAPALVPATMKRLSALAKTQGTSILMAEQRVREVIEHTTRCVVLRQGRLIFDEPSANVIAVPRCLEAILL